MHNEIKVVDFKLSEEEHQKRNWEQTTEPISIDLAIDFFQHFIVDNANSWNDTNYDNYFEEMLQHSLLVEKLKDIQWADKNVNYLKTYNKVYDVKIFYDYTYETYIIERQIEL